MTNIIKEIENQMCSHPHMLALINPSIGMFDPDPSDNSTFLNVTKIKEFDSSGTEHIYDLDRCTLSLSDDNELSIEIHGEALRTTMNDMIRYEPVYDPSDLLVDEEWISVIDVSVLDNSIYVDASLYIPENTIQKIFYNDSSYGFDGSLYFVEMVFTIMSNIEKIKI